MFSGKQRHYSSPKKIFTAEIAENAEKRSIRNYKVKYKD
jgi:hypothetical protein